MIDSQPYLKRAEQRLQTLLATLEEWAQANDMHDNPRIRTIAVVMRALAAFAKPQISFFTHGFDEITTAQPGEWQRGFLDYPTDDAIEYVIGTMIDQVAADLSVYTQALCQRTVATTMPSYMDTLTLADQLATIALQRALPLDTAELIGLGIRGTPIAYLQKSPQVRIIPYAPAAFVGIPFTAIHNPFDLLGIPHEIGHYLFKRYTMPSVATARIDGAGVTSAKVQAWTAGTTWAANWIEEIFADAFGFLIAGPAAGITLQERILLRPKAKWIEDDGVYPVEAIRGYIATDCLRIIAQMVTTDLQSSLLAAACFLETRWHNRLMAFGIADKFISFVKNAQSGLLEDARAEVITVLQRIYQELIPPSTTMDEAITMMWSTGLVSADQVDAEENLLQQFGQVITTIRGNQPSVPELQISVDKLSFQLKELTGIEIPYVLGKTGEPFEEIRDAALDTGSAQGIACPQDWSSFTVRVMERWGPQSRGAGHTHNTHSINF